MAMDSPELADRIASLARQHAVEKVVLHPSARQAWEYDSDGRILFADVPAFAVSQHGKRLVCVLPPDSEGQWACGVQDDGVEVTSFIEEFPD